MCEERPYPVAPVGHEPLRDLVADVFVAAGTSREHAEEMADHLVEADLRGVASHGVTRTAVYVSRLRRGLDRARPSITEVTATPVSALIDGDNGPGIVVAGAAMRTAIAKATAVGVGVVGVRGSNHCGMLAAYTRAAAERGLIGFAATHAPPNMAPWGGRQPFFGTNPLSCAVPTPPGRPEVVLDMATSHVARGKIMLADKAGTAIPTGWALDADGVPTQDTAAALAGSMLPLGGAKGSGLAMLVEILCGPLTGAAPGPRMAQLDGGAVQDAGHFFLALRPDLFGPADAFADRMADLADEMAAVAPAPGHDRVRLPGEPEIESTERRREHGIPLAAAVRRELAGVAAELGITRERTAFLGCATPVPDAAATVGGSTA